VILEESPMNTVIIQTQYAVFMFDQKQVKQLIARNKSEYDPDEITRLLELISPTVRKPF
jgi:hypothetical protein